MPPGRPEPVPWLPWASTGDGRPVARRSLTAEPGSCKEARDFTAGTLRRWAMAGLCRDAIVVISELVTNALRHTMLPEPPGAPGCRPIEVILFSGECRLVCAVTDPCQRPPVLREPDFAAETGRGLHVVASLSDMWGWLPLGRGGKVVWAALGSPVLEERGRRDARAVMASCEDDDT